VKILVVGSGGREHAILWALSKSSNAELFCAPGNAGIGEIARCVPLNVTDIAALAQFAESEGIALTIPGGETSLAAGIVDHFAQRGLRVVGPDRSAARLESSKSFSKEFMTRYRIPTAKFMVANSIPEARNALSSGLFGPPSTPVVVKADGLAAGKGVVVARDHREAEQAITDLMQRHVVGKEAAQRLVLEETLTGRELSLLLFTDGVSYSLMPVARDHKRVGEGDTGLNTGGMGVVTDPGLISKELLARVTDEIVQPTLEGFSSEGMNFTGVLFIGLMMTEKGPYVLEYNVRFGDPEAQAILVRLKSSLLNVCESLAAKELGRTRIEWSEDSSACVVLASRGYPSETVTGDIIKGLNQKLPKEVQIFHSGTALNDRGQYLTAGGRVLGITSTGDTLDRALAECYTVADKIVWNGKHFRRDIGRFST
jgi:phosphoribosylamine---glycine ligase